MLKLMSDQAGALSIPKRIGSFLGWSFVAALAAGIVCGAQMGALNDQNPARLIAIFALLGLLGWPVALVGAGTALALRPFRNAGLWPLLVACAATVLAAAAVQLLNTVMGPMRGESLGTLVALAAVCGFLLQSRRGVERAHESPSAGQLKASRRTIIWIVSLTVLLGIVIWATSYAFSATGPHVITEHRWRAYAARQQWLAYTIDLEIIGYFLACAAVIWRHNVLQSRTAAP